VRPVSRPCKAMLVTSAFQANNSLNQLQKKDVDSEQKKENSSREFWCVSMKGK
jgi:hypothetical protein